MSLAREYLFFDVEHSRCIFREVASAGNCGDLPPPPQEALVRELPFVMLSIYQVFPVWWDQQVAVVAKLHRSGGLLGPAFSAKALQININIYHDQ
jgi:hypothetical protein